MQNLRSKRIVAAFVLAFLCLNLGGLLCLTYCSQMALAAPAVDDSLLSEHCRSAKKEAARIERNSTKVSATTPSCCMMPISMFAVPLEKHSHFAHVLSLPAANIQLYSFSPSTVTATHIAATPTYRPPPLDRRVERISHSVIRT